MSDLDVRIVKLEPVRVASFHGFGESPEDEAWNKPWPGQSPRACFTSRSTIASMVSTIQIPRQAARITATSSGWL